MKIYTPDGVVAEQTAGRAATLGTLAGKRIGILDNRKPNAGLLMGRVAEEIARRTGAEVAVVESKNAAIAAPDQVLGKLTKEVELVLTGSAD